MKPSREKILKFTSTLLAVFALSAALIGFFRNIMFEREATTLTSSRIEKQAEAVRSIIDSSFYGFSVVKEDLRQLKSLFDSLTSSARGKDFVKFTRLENRISKLEEELENLNSVILDNPKKALDLILMKQELENLKNEIEQMNSSFDNQIGRMYNLSTWVFGLMITLAVALTTIAISTIKKEKKLQE